MKEISLPSGAKLRLSAAPFAEAKALYQAVMAEVKGVKLDREDSMMNLSKTVLATALSSEVIDRALATCAARSLYNGKSMKDECFEDSKAREDYLPAMLAVLEENLLPFSKSLSVQFSALQGRLLKLLASE